MLNHLYCIDAVPLVLFIVAIGNAANAGLLAVRILAASDKQLLSKMDAYMMKQEEDVLRKATKLETVGYKAYLANNSSGSHSTAGPSVNI
jgi:phosphoribosylcarboxyaminoimidazole (NCAIR) mutase